MTAKCGETILRKIQICLKNQSNDAAIVDGRHNNENVDKKWQQFEHTK